MAFYSIYIVRCEKGIRAKIEGTGHGNVLLKLGYVAVRNRTQEEVDNNVSGTYFQMMILI